MSSTSLLALLGVTFLLPCVHALDCQWAAIETVLNTSQMPVEWTNGKKTCDFGDGCQDTLMLIENGPQVNLVLTKGCTSEKDHEVQVTEHRTGPGLSVISYTHVCRHRDLCNDLSTSVPLWSLHTEKVLGTLQCPVCFSRYNCPEKASQQFCPVGQTHCYNGVLKLRGGGIATNLKVQGCLPKPGCDLLNGTQKIGPIAVSENCNPKSDTLTCNRGVMLQMGRKLAQDPVEWTSSTNQMCDPEEVAAGGSRAVPVQTCLCSPAAPAPGGLQCPACVQFLGSCSQSSNLVTCPSGVTHCYDGNIAVNGGGLSTTLSIQGCMAPASKYLLNHTRNVGIFSVRENFEDDNKEQSRVSQSGVARATYLLWVMGMGLFLALWNGGLYPLC
nr:CD177 antigen isoform X4 [Marmota flaviventris]